MPHKKILLCLPVLLMFITFPCNAQVRKDSAAAKTFDNTSKKNILAIDTSARKFNPRVATFRSAVLPGWGQAYNKKYWKIPIVYGALGTTAAVFFYNLKTYKVLRQAVIYRSDTIPSNDALVDPQFINLTTESIRTYRNSFRQNVDYSVLVFLIFWGLNVVDATVDAHLKSFDIGDNISMRIKPGFDARAKTGGINFAFSFRDKHPKVLPSSL